MTIDMLIELLEAMKETSPLRGDTVVYVCVPELEYQDIQTVAFIAADDGGTVSLGIDGILPEAKFYHLDGYDQNDGLCDICRSPDYVAGTHPQHV